MSLQPMNKRSNLDLSPEQRAKCLETLEQFFINVWAYAHKDWCAAPFGSAFLPNIDAPFNDIDIVVNLNNRKTCVEILAASERLPGLRLNNGSNLTGIGAPWFTTIMVDNAVNLILVDSVTTFRGYVYAQSIVQKLQNPSKAERCRLFETIAASPVFSKWEKFTEEYGNDSHMLPLIKTQLER